MADAPKRRASDEEWALRRKLAILCRILGMQNSIGLYGHVSIRVLDTDLVLMTPGAGSHPEFRDQVLHGTRATRQPG